MLVRISCRSCRLDALWTDDPEGFLETVCGRGAGCRALGQRRGRSTRRSATIAGDTEPAAIVSAMALSREPGEA